MVWKPTYDVIVHSNPLFSALV